MYMELLIWDEMTQGGVHWRGFDYESFEPRSFIANGWIVIFLVNFYFTGTRPNLLGVRVD